jgi:hypothetical protein
MNKWLKQASEQKKTSVLVSNNDTIDNSPLFYHDNDDNSANNDVEDSKCQTNANCNLLNSSNWKENLEPKSNKIEVLKLNSAENNETKDIKRDSKKLKLSIRKGGIKRMEMKSKKPKIENMKQKSKSDNKSKRADDAICEIYAKSPLGIQFLIGQYCKFCNEFICSSDIEKEQEKTTKLEIPCEHCQKYIEPKVRIQYTLPSDVQLEETLYVSIKEREELILVTEECIRLSRKAIKMIIFNINQCHGNSRQIESKWILVNQRHLFWNILYQHGNIQKHIANVLNPKSKGQKSIIELLNEKI